MIRYAVFDLDGTLTDSGPGIMNSIKYALNKRNIAVPGEEVLRSFIGPPLKEQFRTVFRLSDEEGTDMVRLYREYFREKGIFENSVYKGIPELLRQIKDSGRKIIMATSKPEIFAKRITEHFDLDRYFDFVGGASMDGSRTEKYEVIEYALGESGISENERRETVMIGDREHDIIGAKRAGLHSIGVLYGYGSAEELRKAGAEQTADTPEQVYEKLSLF